MKKNILITGATGFTGKYVLEKLLHYKDQYNITIFARNPDKVRQLQFHELPVSIKYGAFENPDSFNSALQNQDILINIASLGFGHAKTIIDICKNNKTKRTIFISTTSIFTKLNPSSKKIRLEAETTIRNSGLNYTILRPTMIFGTPEDRNICKLIKYIYKWPVIPIFGPGTYLLQPIYVKDLATAIINTLHSNQTTNKEYNLSGHSPLTYNQIIAIISKQLNKNIIRLHVPLWISKIIFSIYEKSTSDPKIKLEQILRLNENKAFDHTDAIKDFNFSNHSFKEIIRNEIKNTIK